MKFLNNNTIELSSENIVNRRNIKWVVHQIDVENLNGCNFKEPYVTQNIDSAKNMMLFASFLDEENDNLDKKLYYGHGEEIIDGDGYIFPNVNIVGCATDAYVCELEFDGVTGTYLVAEGYLQEDKCKGFVEQLEAELSIGNPPKTSIEITKKKDTTGIVYESGKWTPTNRTPTEYSYNGSCFVINPSDKSAVLLELNEEQKKELEVNKDLKKDKIIVESKTIELNELSYDDISTLICRAFRNIMSSNNSDYGYWYYPHKLYPSGIVVFESDTTPKEYYQTTYAVDGKSVTIGDVIEVEETWTPTGDEKQIEINSSLVKDILLKTNEGGNTEMEKNEKFEEINVKLDDLTAKLTDSDTKVAELNSTIVEANKALEDKTKEIEGMTEELNTLRAFKETADLEAKKVEVNSYFENEIKKNGFNEVELNSLKSDFVDKCDLDGLKAKEMELCVKKVKEIATTNIEINSQKVDNNDLFSSIRNTETKTDDNSDLY